MLALFKSQRIPALLVSTLLWMSAGAHGSDPNGETTRTGDVLTLDQAVTLALQNNRELTIADLEVGRAQQRVAAARTRLLPSLSLSAQGGRLLNEVKTHFPQGSLGSAADGSPLPSKDVDVTSPTGFSSTVTATISQPLTQVPRLRSSVRLQQIGTNIAREEQREQRQALIASVKGSYYSILQTQSAIAADEESLKACRELERTVGDFVAQQTALRSDLLDVQSRTAQQELTLLKLRNALAQQKETLNLLMGRDVQAPFEVVALAEPGGSAERPISHADQKAGAAEAADQQVDAAEENVEALQARALKQWPDLRRSALLVQQAETDRRIKQQEFLPELSLATNYYQIQSNINGVPDHVWTVGFQMSWNPFDWGRRQREVAEKGKVVEQARIALSESRERALVEVNSQARKLREAREQVKVAQVSQAAARERLRVMMDRYQVREVLLKDGLEAQASFAHANRQVQEAMLQWFTAQADVAKAVGEDR
jgi:outer membrane protein